MLVRSTVTPATSDDQPDGGDDIFRGFAADQTDEEESWNFSSSRSLDSGMLLITSPRRANSRRTMKALAPLSKQSLLSVTDTCQSTAPHPQCACVIDFLFLGGIAQLQIAPFLGNSAAARRLLAADQTAELLGDAADLDIFLAAAADALRQDLQQDRTIRRGG